MIGRHPVPWLVTLAAAGASASGGPQVELTEIARSGLQPPDRPGESFTTFSDPSLGQTGIVTFKGSFDGPPSGNEGIFLFDGGVLHRVVDDSFDFNPPGQSGATSWTSFGPSVINDAGQMVFRGNFSFGDNSQGLYVFTSTSAQVIFDDSPLQPVPGQPGAVGFSTFPMSAGLLPLVSAGGDSVTVATFLDRTHVQRDGVYVGNSATGIERIADVTMAPPGQASASFAGFDWLMVMNGLGDVALHAGYTGGLGSTGIYHFTRSTGVLRTVADGRTVPPDQTPPARFTAIDVLPSINDASHVAFRADYVNGVGTHGIFIDHGTGAMTTIVDDSGRFAGPERPAAMPTIVDDSGRFAVPDRPGASWLQIGQPVINGAGQVGFAADFGPAADQKGIFLATDGTIESILAFDDPVPGQPGASFFAAGSIIVNARGHVAFTARYSGGAGDEGIYLYDGAHVHRIVDESQSLLGQTATNLHMMLGIGGSGGQDGKPRTFNDADQIAFRADLAGGGQGVYLADITSGCSTDLDGNGVTDVDDLVNVILSFGSCPPSDCAGDVDSDGDVDVDDLVAVILGWGNC